MRSSSRLLLFGLAFAVVAAAPPGRVRDGRGAIVADTTLAFSVTAGSRLYPDWKETTDVRLGEEFFLGDLPYTAAVTAFMSDFKIEGGQPMNFEPTLENPAVFVVVYADTGAVDSTWAFLNFPPHFSPTSFFTFQLQAIEGYEAPAAGTGGN